MTRTCSFDGCGKHLTSHSARGLCTGHYQQWKRGEDLRVSQSQLARRYGVAQSSVWKIIHRLHWGHV